MSRRRSGASPWRLLAIVGTTLLAALLITSILVLLLVPRAEQGRRRPTEAQDRLWDEHMLTATYGHFAMDQRVGYEPSRSWEWVDGTAGTAGATKQGVVVCARKNWWLLFATTGLGWCLEGGLIGLVALDRGAIELHAKSLSYDGPEFVPLVLLFLHGRSARQALYYEFFLLLREAGTGRALVLKKWAIPVDWKAAFVSPQGKLRHEPASAQAIVEVISPTSTTSFVDRVDLPPRR